MWHRNSPESPLSRYWDLPGLLIANNSRVASVSIHMAIIARFGTVVGASEPTKPVYLLVREPVCRYVSAIRKAKDSGPLDPVTGNHFELQAKLVVGPKVFLYRFPDHLKEFGEDTGLGEIPWINHSISPLPALTVAERQKVLQRYAADMLLFESISHPKTIALGNIPLTMTGSQILFIFREYKHTDRQHYIVKRNHG